MGHLEGLERMLERALDQRNEREAENKRLLDQLKRTQTYEASMLGDMERLKTVVAARLARIEELERERDEARRDESAWQLASEQECAKRKEAEKLATQRGARMQIMWEWMQQEDMPRFSSSWREFLRHYSEAADWFDSDGVPK